MLAYIAAFIAFAWVLVHAFVGGREIGRPLRQNESLDELTSAVAWLCWHFTTILIIALAYLPAAGAYTQDTGLVAAGTLVAAAMAIFGIWATLFTKQSYKNMPQGWLFVPIAFLGFLALVT